MQNFVCARRVSAVRRLMAHPSMPTLGNFRLLHDSAECCRHSSAFGALANVAWGAELWRSARRTAPAPAVCQTHCSQNPRCTFFSHSAKRQSCTYCAACDLSATALTSASPRNLDKATNVALRWRVGHTSWAKGAFRVYERVDRHAVVHALVTQWLQTNYSEQLYGRKSAVVAETLRVVWLSLLPPAALDGMVACSQNPNPPLRPFFRPIGRAAGHHMATQPMHSVWIHQPGPHEPVASHGWIEVTHCASRGWGMMGPAWMLSGMWLYAAPGSGVSINVGRTMAFQSYEKASHFLANIFCEPPDCTLNLTRCPPTLQPMQRRGPGLGWQIVPNVGGVTRRSKGVHEALPADLDSIQIIDHYEYYSHEPRHEIVMLHRPECSSLRDLPGLMCGLHPHLFPCPPDGAAITRVSTCGSLGASSPAGKQLVARLHRKPGRCQSTHCYVGNDSHTYCPRGTSPSFEKM